ncbi:D-alanyl-D-alanine carboxypeptidase family protein [Streptomyces indicus]|uniref:D-alanyl-D-alanine carboxypeptidase (Penicillin-binding protein 5/6) n=1 Tax=Streptomyces indicus TaxID=417292 RepID=A0A1G9D828_9ACTN|nr:D-alanyl-D-alanine carboxypeptidase [Streptomyces indicus]SDK60049.1 D-alanyl-D-alanine carboxypeptidase (penicillin-binding protein 5/6) [Streptomyces indicus]
MDGNAGKLRRGVMWGLAGALIVVGTGGFLVLPEGGSAGASRDGAVEGMLRAPGGVAEGLALPWPDEGQAAVAVEQVGVLGTSGPRKPVPIASVTKVMTAYVILRDHPLRDGEDGPLIEVDAQAAREALSPDESSAPVTEGQRLSQRKLLELLLLPSGNNVARLLARWDAGTQEQFVRKMNAAAARLKMKDTTYTGASGFESTTRSTAADQLILARAAMRDPALRATVRMRSTELPGRAAPVPNSNELLDRPGVVGLKTGSSTPAGGNLVWALEVPAGPDGGRKRMVYGVVLGQQAGQPPAAGLRAAFEAGGLLVDTLREKLPAALAHAGRS